VLYKHLKFRLQAALSSRRHRYTYDMTLSDTKIAVVTGAAQGIGAAIALQLAKDGFNVAIVDLKSQSERVNKLVETVKTEYAGRKAIAVYADVSNEEQVDAMVKEIEEKLGPIYVMVANAGVCLSPVLDFSQTRIEDFDRQMSINARGVFLTLRAASKVMIDHKKGGKLIAASSMAGQKGVGMIPGYSASKFAVRGIIQAAAGSLAAFGITANAYCPGPVETPLWDVVGPLVAQAAGQTPDGVNKINHIPLGRIGYPDDVAKLVSFLASENSNYITGQSFNIDGGVIMS